MDVAYWNNVAGDYDKEIFSVLAHDKGNLIESRINKLSSDTKTAADLGCGIGKFLPMLSENFGHVYAYDISDKCLEQARENCRHLSNVEYIRSDLSVNRKIRMPEVDFILCVNSVIMPSMLKRSRYFRSINDHLTKDGHLILVVPSFESAIFSRVRRLECMVRNGQSYSGAVMSIWNSNNKQKATHLQQGVVNIDNVPTKHYLKEELVSILDDLDFHIHEIEKIEYEWTTEFSDPPRWLSGPFPWDWLVVAGRR